MNYAIVAIAVLMVGTPMAFAETFEIETPWAESSGHGCNLNPFNEDQYICTFDRYPVPMTLEDLVEFKDVLTDEEFEQAVEDIVSEIAEDVVVEDPPQTPTEILVERLLEKDDPSEADLATIRALETASIVCELGVEEGARMQTYGTFNLPDRDVSLEGAFSLENYPKLAQVLKKIDECTYWNEYRAKYLAQYNHMELDDENDLSVRLGIGELTAIYEYAFIPSVDNSKVGFCEALHTDAEKYDYGCLVKPVHTMGYIEYESDIIRQYNQFQSGDDSEQLAKNVQKTRNSHSVANYGGQQ